MRRPYAPQSLPDQAIADAELKRMNDLGIRGIRIYLVLAGATTVDMIEPCRSA